MKSSLEEVIPIALSYRIIKNTEPLEEKKLTSLDLSQYMEKSEALKQDEIRKINKREDPMDVDLNQKNGHAGKSPSRSSEGTGKSAGRS